MAGRRLPCMDDMQGFQKIFFPDDDINIVFKTFPIRPDMTAKKVRS